MIYSIAVIGSGMAGLAAAYRARCAGHHVTVFEACDGHGLDAHALTAEGGLVDVPLRVMSPDAWPSLLKRAGIPDLEPPCSNQTRTLYSPGSTKHLPNGIASLSAKYSSAAPGPTTACRCWNLLSAQPTPSWRLLMSPPPVRPAVIPYSHYTAA